MTNTRTYELFESLNSGIKMGAKMFVILALIFSVIHILCFLLLSYVLWTPAKSNTVTFYASKYAEKVWPGRKLILYEADWKPHRIMASKISNSPKLRTIASAELKNSLYLFLLCGLVHFGQIFFIVLLRKRAKDKSGKNFVRGAKLISTEELLSDFKKNNEKLNLPLGQIKMPESLENRHTLIIGKPGTGKTQCIRPILKRWYEQGRQGIVYDYKGEYFAEFYDPDNDMLFNPLDARSLGWNLFNELVSYPDVDALAASLIPPPISNSDPFWNPAARGVFSGILHYLFQNNLRNNSELWKLLTADAQEIADKLKHTKGGEAGYRYITQNAKNSKQAEGVLAVMMQYTKCFEYMAGNDGDFQITDWLYNGKGIIYITNYADIEETLKPVLSLFVDLVGRKILSMPDDLSRRIMFNLDEFGSLQRLSTIVKLLTKGRSKGACIFLGIQDDGQTEKIYTPLLRKSIDSACGNRITFALSGETVEREARYNIGETEFIETQRSTSVGPHDMRDGTSLSEQRKKELLLLPTELSNLPDLTGVVQLRNYDPVISRWEWERAKQIHPPFQLRDELLLENIISTQTGNNEPVVPLKDNKYELDIDTIEL